MEVKHLRGKMCIRDRWNSIEEMDDVRAKGMYREALEQKQDSQKVLEYFGELGRDNARTPMQWRCV